MSKYIKIMRKSLLLFLVLLLTIINSVDLLAQKKKKKDKNNTEEKEPEKSKFEELTEDADKLEGFFNFYSKDGHLYMEVPEDKLNVDFLMTNEIAQGIGGKFLYGGLMLDFMEGNIVALEKHDGKIFLVKKPHRYVSEPGTPQEESVKLSYGSSVLVSAKIETEEEDSITLIDVYGWFVSDLSNISGYVKAAVSTTPGKPGSASFDKDRSHLEYVKSFPENSNIRAKLTFKTTETRTPRELPDGRYLPVSIHYCLAALPEEPMTPREADDRLGYFMTVHKDFTDDNNKSFFNRYVNRWRLECDGEPGADGLCDVKKPIIYYIDRTVPVHYRKAMMDGVNAWVKAFESAGFRDAIHAEMLPDDADAEDIRYSTLRWSTSDELSYGAIGPSVADPRTGEILDADILFEAAMLLGFKNSWRTYLNPASSINSIFEVDENQMKRLGNGCEINNFAAEMISQGALMKTFLVARNESSASEPVPEDVVSEYLKWVTMHEVGHTLGLRHNFRSSSDTPIDKLHDKDWADKNGIYSSVMEYPTPNLSPKGEENGYYYSPGIGSYDRWVISYGYLPDFDKAQEIARQSAKAGHAYGTDEDAYGNSAMDPDVNVFDLSSDPLAWGKQRADLISSLFNNLPEVVLSDNVPYFEVTNAFNALAYQYGRAISTGIKYIGGQYQYRDHMGDPNERSPFVLINKKKQEEALDFLIEYGFSENAFKINPELFQKFGANRWNHWGNTNTFEGRIDYPYYETMLGLQVSVLNQLTNPLRLARIRDAELRHGNENVVGIPQVFKQLTSSIWAEVYSKSNRNVNTLRRDLQRAYLDRMLEIVLNAPEKMPSDAVSVARMQLSLLHGQIKRKINVTGLDDYTRAHLLESDSRIDGILSAGMEVKK
jgi:hypothetical protein